MDPDTNIAVFNEKQIAELFRRVIREEMSVLGEARKEAIRTVRGAVRSKPNGDGGTHAEGRKHRVDLAPEVKKQMIALYEKGRLTQGEVAAKFGVARTTVARAMKGLKGSKRRRKKVTPEIKEAIINARKAKFTYKEISQKTGVSEVAVFMVLHDAGLTKPQPREKK